MPINIYKEGSDPEASVAWLASDSWELPSQIEELRLWLLENRSRLQKARYVADIGFSVRQDASGGGAVIDREMIECLAELGIELFLSEYRQD